MIYLAWTGVEVAVLGTGPWADSFVLGPGLLLIESEATRSRVYHSLKEQVPGGTALLVTALHDAPKFKGLAPGASAWLRAHGASR